MKFLVRFLVFFCIFFLTEAGHTKAHGHLHVISHASLPYHKGKIASDIEMSTNETSEENEDDDERKTSDLNNYFTDFYNTQTSVSHFSRQQLRYFSHCKFFDLQSSSRHILLRVIRI